MNVSELFFAKTSVIDHAIMGPGGIVGGSYNLNFTAQLPTDQFDEEQVVVDFSSGKKKVKELIDGHVCTNQQDNPRMNGWDHKLWVPTKDVKIIWENPYTVSVQDDFSIVSGPSDMFKLVDCHADDLTSMEFVGNQMTKFINNALSSPVEYNVILDADAYPMGPFIKDPDYFYFTYYHGLRNSSSYGCANITHGHLSFIAVSGDAPLEAKDMAADIAAKLDGAYLYHEDIRSNVKGAWNVNYTTSRRGFMSYTDKRDYVKKIVMSHEPTVENIVEMVKNWYPARGYRFAISEGLQKGSLFTI